MLRSYLLVLVASVASVQVKASVPMVLSSTVALSAVKVIFGPNPAAGVPLLSTPTVSTTTEVFVTAVSTLMTGATVTGPPRGNSGTHTGTPSDAWSSTRAR